MDFEKFKFVVDLMVKHNQASSQAYKVGIDLIEYDERQSIIINYLFAEILTSEGFEWFEWFMYDKNYIKDGVGNPELTATQEITDPKSGETKKIEINQTLEELHQYLTQNNYFKCQNLK